MIRTLTSWRGLFVLSVVLMHSGIHAADQLSWAAVDFFFIASGFLMSMRHPTADGTSTAAACGQSALRLARRVYPIHWLALVIVIAAFIRDGRALPMPALAANALLVQSWVPVRDVFLSFNKPSWFLATLLALHAAYPVLRRMMDLLGHKGQAGLITAYAATLAVTLWLCDQPTRDWLHAFPPTRAGDFLLGMAVHDIWQDHRWRRAAAALGANTLELAAVATLVAFVAADRLSGDTLVAWNSNLLFWPPVAAVVLASATANGHEGVVGRVLLWRPFTWLGSISLEMYMMHTPTGLIVDRLVAPVLGHFGMMNYDIEWLMTLTALFPVAWLTRRWLTQPLARRLNNVNEFHH